MRNDGGDFGNPKNSEAGMASNAIPPGSNGTGPASADAVAACIVRHLQSLHHENVRAERESLDGKYRRLGFAYAHGLHLSADEDVRICFYAAALWSGFSGHKPDPERHGPDDAMRFAVMSVFGGTVDSRQEASMFASACWVLAYLKVPESEFLDTLKRYGGPKALAALAAEIRREMAESPAGGPPDPAADGNANDDGDGGAGLDEASVHGGGDYLRARRRPPRVLTLEVPEEVAGCELPPVALFYAVDNRELLLTAVPGSYHPVLIPVPGDV